MRSCCGRGYEGLIHALSAFHKRIALTAVQETGRRFFCQLAKTGFFCCVWCVWKTRRSRAAHAASGSHTHTGSHSGSHSHSHSHSGSGSGLVFLGFQKNRSVFLETDRLSYMPRRGSCLHVRAASLIGAYAPEIALPRAIFLSFSITS